MKYIAILLILMQLVFSCKSVTQEHNIKEVIANKINIDSLLKTTDTVKILIAINDYVTNQFDINGKPEQLSTEQINFHLIEELEMEVNNGGFSQYFYNSGGDYAHETLDALMAIKAFETHKLLQAAINEFPAQKVPKDRLKRQKMLVKIEDKASTIWDMLDNKYYKSTDNLDLLKMIYINANRAKF